jgi:flagellar protein FlaG
MSIELSIVKSTVNESSNNQQNTINNDSQLLNNAIAVTAAGSDDKVQSAPVAPLAQEPAQETAQEPARQVLQKEQLEVMAKKLQEFVGELNKGLEFSVDQDSGRDVIKVIDRSSGEIVRQYPSEEVLDLVASLSDAAGNFVNIKA